MYFRYARAGNTLCPVCARMALKKHARSQFTRKVLRTCFRCARHDLTTCFRCARHDLTTCFRCACAGSDGRRGRRDRARGVRGDAGRAEPGRCAAVPHVGPEAWDVQTRPGVAHTETQEVSVGGGEGVVGGRRDVRGGGGG